MVSILRLRRRRRRVNVTRLFCLLLTIGICARAQQPAQDWQSEVRAYSRAQDWTKAFQVVNAVLARSPGDIEARAWRAWLLLWSGDVAHAETEFLSLTKDAANDPDMWEGLASVYGRQARWTDALQTLDIAIRLDPRRADLRAERARALRALNRRNEARTEFRRVLEMDPSSAEARAGLLSLESPLRNELRVGTDTDLLNYTGNYEGQWVSLVSHWNSHWDTSVSGNFFERGGFEADKVMGSITGKSPSWGALTVGAAVGHDNGIIPRSEAFFGYDRGWRVSEDKFFRGFELTYDQHWYWYSSARILTTTGGTLVYFPREWSWSFALTGERNVFSGLPPAWRPSGISRLNFPLAHWGERHLSGNILYAVGTEDFALLDQIGSFASQTYGGGLRFEFSSRQDVTGYGAFQQRTQDHTDASFGFSYGIHF
jgi:tetratricopeptide (TPR) repeat protein